MKLVIAGNILLGYVKVGFALILDGLMICSYWKTERRSFGSKSFDGTYCIRP